MNISLRQIDNYVSIDDNQIDRVDVLFGYLQIRPEWIVPTTREFFIPSAPAIITLKETLILGAAAVLIKNPVVSRRFWAGWKL